MTLMPRETLYHSNGGDRTSSVGIINSSTPDYNNSIAFAPDVPGAPAVSIISRYKVYCLTRSDWQRNGFDVSWQAHTSLGLFLSVSCQQVLLSGIWREPIGSLGSRTGTRPV